MSNSESKFQLYYGYNLCKLNSKLNARFSNFITFLQIILGSAIAVDISQLFNLPYDIWNFTVGGIVVIFSALMFVYKYNEVALLSKQQSERYKNIISLLNTDPKLDINAELNNIEKYDVDISGVLEEIAFKRSAIQLSLEDTTELTLYQRIIAKLAGEYFS